MKLKNNWLLVRLLFATAFMSVAFSGKATSKKALPNLLILIVDTLRADHVGCYGYQQVKTPAIDGLAKQGVLFENAL